MCVKISVRSRPYGQSRGDGRSGRRERPRGPQGFGRGPAPGPPPARPASRKSRRIRGPGGKGRAAGWPGRPAGGSGRAGPRRASGRRGRGGPRGPAAGAGRSRIRPASSPPASPSPGARPARCSASRTRRPTAQRGSPRSRRQQGQVLDVLLAAAVRLQADRGDRPARPSAGRVEERERVGLLPRLGRADRLPGEDAVGARATRRRGTSRPAARSAPRSALVPPYSTTICAVGRLAVEDDPAVRPHRAADDVVVEQAVERRRAATAGGRCRRGRPASPGPAGLVDPLVEGRAEVAQGPEVLEVRRLVEQPGGRPARPALAP